MAGQAIVVPAKSDITSLRQLNGRQVIIIYGSTGEMSVRMNVPDATIIGYKTYIDGFNALKAMIADQSSDAMIADDTVLYGLTDFTMDDDSVKFCRKDTQKFLGHALALLSLSPRKQIYFSHSGMVKFFILFQNNINKCRVITRNRF